MNDIAKRVLASNSVSVKRLNPHLFGASPASGGVSPGAKLERDPVDVNVGEDAGEALNQERRFVRVTSYRRRLLDERNLFDKHFVDALREAGAIVDDSKKWAEVHVRQIKVERKEEERTEIELWNLGPVIG